MTRSTAMRRPVAVGWPTPPPHPSFRHTASAELGWSGLGWPVPTAHSRAAPPQALVAEPAAEEEDTVPDDGSGAAAVADSATLDLSQKRIRTVLDDAVVSRETTIAGPTLAGLGVPYVKNGGEPVPRDRPAARRSSVPLT